MPQRFSDGRWRAEAGSRALQTLRVGWRRRGKCYSSLRSEGALGIRQPSGHKPASGLRLLPPSPVFWKETWSLWIVFLTFLCWWNMFLRFPFRMSVHDWWKYTVRGHPMMGFTLFFLLLYKHTWLHLTMLFPHNIIIFIFNWLSDNMNSRLICDFSS